MQGHSSTIDGNNFSELETVLVKLFRLCQELLAIVKKERQYLIDGNVDELEEVFITKSTLLTNIESLSGDQEKIVRKLSTAPGASERMVPLSELLAKVESVSSERIKHLQQGILSLQKEIREFNGGNFALATLNLQQVQAVQDFLVDSVQPPSTFYGPKAGNKPDQSPRTWQMDQNI